MIARASVYNTVSPPPLLLLLLICVEDILPFMIGNYINGNSRYQV